MKELFMYNIFDFIARNDKDVVVDKLKGKSFDKELLEGISPRYLWIMFGDYLGFDKRTKMLFEYFKDSLEKEKYRQSHQLKKEIIRSCGISERLLKMKSKKIVEKFHKSIHEHKRHKYLLKDVCALQSELENDGINKFPVISKTMDSMNFQLQLAIDPDSVAYNLEIADMVNLNKITHPYILIDHMKFFFSFFRDNEVG